MILECTCTHKYQDKKYGKNQRVHNPKGGSVEKATGWRCTVCKKDKDVARGSVV